ncbi:TonB-dependent receptor [Pseudomonas putida]|uniref:TonB-dependent receptor n=1 Tax=Pseudomonas putida TaxID=303 RepID=A0A4D6X6T8_PSEPU|nr:TonB-dependent receptor [Pseudomonas putida]QCI11743.1 TonB-dependent receptor [Pseudomonas putida]
MKSVTNALGLGAVLGLLYLPAAQAAEPETTGDSASQAAPALKKITVTATRREESLQKVPVAVTVVDGEQLEREGRANISTIVQEIPTLNYRSSSSNKDSSLFVRGIGTISTSPGVEPSVATVVDGVVFARPGQSTLDLLDVDRIEVLRGPQGTLFGKNASAGVLNIVTRDIDDTTHGFAEYSYYGGNENRLRFGIGGRLSETLKGSLTTSWGDYAGNVENVANGHDVNGYDRKGVRGKLQFDPSDTLKLTLIGDYSDGEDDTTSTLVIPSAAVAAALGPVNPSKHNRKLDSDYRTYVEDRNRGLSLQADWTVADYTLTSISAWRGWNNAQYQDNDSLSALPVTAVHDKGLVDFDQYSQEFRLASPKGQFAEYVLGTYLFHGKSKETYRRLSVNDSVPTTGRADYSATNDSYAVFGESTFNLRSDLRVIFGLRWTLDQIEYDHRRISSSTTAVNSIRPGFASSGSHQDSGVSGRLGLQYDINDSLTSYATYSRGYKGPAYNVYFNMQAIDVEPLDPETSDTYEIGLKSTAWDNRLTANLALFHSKYDNYQANAYDVVGTSVVTRLINAGSVISQGAELDWALQATRQLKLSGALAYTRARIDTFACPPGAVANCNIDGKPLPFTPDWKSYVRADYSIPLDNGWDVELGTDYTWQSEVQYSLDQNPTTKQGAYGIWNASVALADYNEGWRVALLAKNLTDKSYSPSLSAGASTSRIVPRDDGRYFGVQLRKDF